MPAAAAIGPRRRASLFQRRVWSHRPADGADLRAAILADGAGAASSNRLEFKTLLRTQPGSRWNGLLISPTRVIPEPAFETYNSAYWRGLALPWGGLFGTPREAVRFAAAFLPSGERFLSEAATSLMTMDQTMGVPGGVESAKVRWDPGRWGLGWEVKGEKRRHWTGDFTSPRTFCHFGHAGTLLWGDPERDMALAVFANRTVTHMWGFILPRWARLSNAVIAAITETCYQLTAVPGVDTVARHSGNDHAAPIVGVVGVLRRAVARVRSRAVTPENPRLLSLVSEAIEGRYSRREIVRRGVAIGLAAPAIGMALSRVSAASVAAQDGPVQVSIVNKEMTPDEIVAAIQSEGEVNVGNWTYTANDTLVAKFQEHVSSTYGVDITLNYEASQAPSTYHDEPLYPASER